MNLNRYAYHYFLILFSAIPLSIVIGSAVSVINILLIDLSFIVLLVNKKNFSFLKDKTIIYLFVLYGYLIFNSFISIDYSEGILRNLGFLRIIILFVAFNYFYHENLFFSRMLKIWLIIILIIIIDVFIEYIYGTNLLGFGEVYGNRIVSFFKDEPIVGGFLNGFFLILIGFFINLNKKYNYFMLLFIIFFLVSIFITGERSNTIRALLGISTFLVLYKEINFKNKLLFFSIIFFIISALILNSHYLKTRFINQVKVMSMSENIYFDLYQSGFQVFQNNKIFGVGNKNYRVETCKKNKKLPIDSKDKYLCSTHPHQIYFELLSEHGLLGTFIILLILYKLIFSKITKITSEPNYLKIGSLIYLIFVFTPIIPSGAFFNNYMITIFTINLSIFYACDKNLNVFKIKPI